MLCCGDLVYLQPSKSISVRGRGRLEAGCWLLHNVLARKQDQLLIKRPAQTVSVGEGAAGGRGECCAQAGSQLNIWDQEPFRDLDGS